MLDVTDRTAVIIGGGAVAARKARGLLEAGARVRCVSPVFSPDIPANVERVQEGYDPRHLEGAFIVFAATDNPQVNNAVASDARARKLLVSRADVDEGVPGDFVVPASHRAGNVLMSVAAASPALSAMIRDKLAQKFDVRWQQLADLMTELRPAIIRSGLEIERRRQIFRDLATDAALDAIGRHGPEGLRRWLIEKYPELQNA
jgi:precorrin-2 dehydrogenase/sirohydrochlorin ferrochelatase